MLVKNKLNTLATAPGLDYLFEPGEIKEVKNPKELEFIRKCPDIFEILEKEPVLKENSIICEICGFLAKSQFGLKIHKKRHK